VLVNPIDRNDVQVNILNPFINKQTHCKKLKSINFDVSGLIKTPSFELVVCFLG